MFLACQCGNTKIRDIAPLLVNNDFVAAFLSWHGLFCVQQKSVAVNMIQKNNPLYITITFHIS